MGFYIERSIRTGQSLEKGIDGETEKEDGYSSPLNQ